MSTVALILVALSTTMSVLLSVRAGALVLAAGLALMALLAHLQRGKRTPWRSDLSDVASLATLAVALLALSLVLP